MSIKLIGKKGKFALLIFAVLFTSATFLGCEGDDGATGPAGPPGEDAFGIGVETCGLCHNPGHIADVAAEHAEAIPEFSTVTITGVTIPPAGTPIVDFTVTGPDSTPTLGLTASNFRFTIAQLVPAAALSGDSDSWQSYINISDVHDPGEPGSTPEGTETTLASTENDGTLVDNGGGTYTYTFTTDITNVTSPVAVPFVDTLVHRTGVYLTGSIPRGDAVFTFIPATGTPVATAREIVDVSSCNECHNKLAAHHNQRFSTEICVNCHNPGSVDALTGNTLDLKVMIHKIHRGEELPSVVGPDGELGTDDDGQYAINHHGSFRDFSNVVFPAGPSIPELRHCTKCHNNAVAVDADNWQNVPTREACGSCHDDVNFDTGENHPGGVQTSNGGCTLCHPATGGPVNAGVADSHVIPELVASEAFAYNLISVTNTAPGEFPVVTFSVTDPTNADAPYDILNDPEFTTPSVARLVIDLGWPTTDYTNIGTLTPPSRAIEINPVSDAVDNGDGTFTVTSSVAVPASITGSGVVAIEGHPAVESVPGSGDFDTRAAAVKSAVDFFPITDATAVPRRLVVDINNCDQCHIVLSLHGSNRVDEPRLCVICHNANNTDINRRPADPATTPDGKREEAIDFKRMIHAIHAGGPDHGIREEGIVVYGFGGTPHDYSEVRFPGILNDCQTCHLPGTNELPLGDNVLATTIDSGADIADPSDDLNITPTAAVCTACHDDATTRAHVEINGASFEFVQP